MASRAGIISGGDRSTDDERLILEPEPVYATENPEDFFRPLKTVPIFSFHLLVSILISVSGIILAICSNDDKRCEAYFIMTYLRVLFWIITLIVDHTVKHHHDNLRLNGYHEFYRSTSVHKGIPFLLVSLWNTVILGLQTLMHHYYGPDFAIHCIESRLFSPVVYVTLLSTMETFLLALINGSYIVKVRKFNRSKVQADAARGSSTPSGTVGLLMPGSRTTELLEKQADLIHYLKEHNFKLNQKIMHLNSQVINTTQHYR